MFLGVEELALCFAAVANFGIGLYVFLTNPRDPARQAFFLFVGGTSLWIGGFWLLRITQDFAFDTITQFGGLVGTLGFFLFAQLFPHKRLLPVRPWILYAPFLIAAVGIIPRHFIVAGIQPIPGGRFVPIPGQLATAWMLLIGAYMLAGISLLIAQVKSARGKAMMQMRYFFFGVGFFVSIAVLCDAFLPAAFNISALNACGPLSSVISVGVCAYAIVRHQLMDIRVAIQRGAIYALLLVLIVLIYLTILTGVGFVVGEGEGEEIISSIITTVFGILTVPFLDKALRRATDRIFFQDTYDYAAAMQSLSEVLYTSTDLGVLIERMQKCLMEIFRARAAKVVLYAKGDGRRDAPKEYENRIAERLALYQPIRIDMDEVGSILIGEKRSGDHYRAEDDRLLRTFSLQAATALARAQLYRQVREYAIEIEERVAKRTQEMQKTQENQQQMMLDIAHGLQTPLAIFQTKLERLKSLGEQAVDVGTFEESLMNLSDFIEHLLKLAQMENDGSAMRLERCSLSKLVEGIAEEVEVVAASRDIRVTCNIEPGVEVDADEKELRSAVMNLASNAIKYMRQEGAREIRFELHALGADARLSIRDTGIGIAAKDLPHIFERFYRARSESNISGGGLGLAISKRIIERHGGGLTAQSEAGRGTTMTMRLPQAKTPAKGA